MKKSKVIEIFKFLSTIKLNKINDKDVRSAVVSNHLQMYSVSKKYEEDVEELRKRVFEGKTEELEELIRLREEFKGESNTEKKSKIIAKIAKDYKEILELENSFYKELNSILDEEVQLNLKKVNKESFVDTCAEAEVNITGGDLIFLEELFED